MKEFLLIFLSLYLLFRVFRKQIARLIFGQVAKKFDAAQRQQQKAHSKPEGEITIEKANVSSSKHTGDSGEYVDYEEVK